MVSSGQESHIASDFDHLDLWNAMVPLMMLSGAHDADTDAVALHDAYGSGIM